MCGRFTRYHDTEAFVDVFGIDVSPSLAPSYNIAPSQPILAVRQREKSSEPELAIFHWGLIPHWAKDRSVAYKMINARSETVDEKPSYKSLFKTRRCLVATDGWYEWQKTDTGKQPYYIHRHDKCVFFFAGLWSQWENKSNNETIESCTILTRSACPALESIHIRMPVVLPAYTYGQWLDTDNQNTDRLKLLALLQSEEEFDYYPVSTDVNKPSNNDLKCIEHIAK